MISFECDYNNGAHSEVLRHLIETNDGQTLTYGFDEYSQRATSKIREACSAPRSPSILSRRRHPDQCHRP